MISKFLTNKYLSILMNKKLLLNKKQSNLKFVYQRKFILRINLFSIVDVSNTNGLQFFKVELVLLIVLAFAFNISNLFSPKIQMTSSFCYIKKVLFK